MTDDDVKSLLQTFGELKAVNIVRNTEGMFRGFCFFRY
jgi:RNA recognition motif-containing protein